MNSNIKFSLQEKKILQYLSQAKSRKTIAQELQISVNTVDTHLRNIRTKTNTHSIPEILVWSIKNNS